MLDRLQPLGVEAALAGIDARSQKRSEKRDQLEFALQQARYEAARAQRQYDAIDPDNRLVAGELERRWNERLVAVRNLEIEIDQLDAGTEQALTGADRERLMALGRDLTRPGTALAPRPRRARRLSAPSFRRSSSTSSATRWSWSFIGKAAITRALTVKKNRIGQTDGAPTTDIVDLVRALARHMPDQTIAAVLNRLGQIDQPRPQLDPRQRLLAAPSE